MIVSFDLSTLNSPKQAFAKKMLLDTEMIAINQVLFVCARAQPTRCLERALPAACNERRTHQQSELL
jgi:hypothetical protein